MSIDLSAVSDEDLHKELVRRMIRACTDQDLTVADAITMIQQGEFDEELHDSIFEAAAEVSQEMDKDE